VFANFGGKMGAPPKQGKTLNAAARQLRPRATILPHSITICTQRHCRYNFMTGETAWLKRFM
jgi:hypothetical protein